MRAAHDIGLAALLALTSTAACADISSARHESVDDGDADRTQPIEIVPTVPVEAVFEGNVVYLGLDITPPRLTPGDRAVVTQYWRLNTPFSRAQRATIGGWTSYLRAEGPYRRGFIATKRQGAEASSVDTWVAGSVIKEEFTLQVPEDWTEPALWLFAGIGAESVDARPGDSLQVLQGPDEDGRRIRVLTVRVKRPWSGGLPSWVSEARRSELSQFVE